MSSRVLALQITVTREKNEDTLIRYNWKSRGELFLTDPGEYLNDMYVENLVEFAEYRRDSSDTSGPRTSSYMERESLIDVMNMKHVGNRNRNHL